jgi:hypothetical protein
MTEPFENGYAAVIGVDENNIPNLALPTVAKDVQAVYDVLVHPERCAYKPDNVRLLKGSESTRANILAALDWLQEQANADPNATAVLYYSGHGAVDAGNYYLIPYDINFGSIYSDAIPAEAFNGRITATNARRLLVVFDCCHAGGVGAKNAGLESLAEEGEDELPISPEAFPIDLPAGDLPDYEGEPGEKSLGGGLEVISDLLEGEGRAVLNSSTGAQKSYLRQDRTMSLFTYHFIEALTGHAPHHDDDTTVLVTDVMSWVTREVKKSAMLEGRNQTPVMRTSGVFPVAQLLGGKGLAKGLGEVAPDPLEALPPVAAVTLNQQGQTVHGAQVNAGRDAHIGHFGNVTQGDTITVGDISGASGIAIGREAKATVTTTTVTGGGTGGGSLFGQLQALVAREAPALAGKVGELQAQAARGAAADDNTVAGLIADLAQGAPGAGGMLKAIMTGPEGSVAAGGPATKFVLGRIN